MSKKYALGIDIGSTTVKYVVCDSNFNILAKAYTPHDTKQASTLLKLLEELSQTHSEIYKSIKILSKNKCIVQKYVKSSYFLPLVI